MKRYILFSTIALIVLAACGTTTVGVPASGAVPRDGKFVGSGMGVFGPVTVAVTFKDGTITLVRHLSSNETNYIGDAAIGTIPAQITQYQSLRVDSVAGATITSGAIKGAIRQAVIKAGGDPAIFETPVTYPVPEKKTVEKNVDVVIMGGGGAGLMAAWTLVKEGKSVIVFEKMSFLGGCLVTSAGAIASVDTKVHKAYGPERLSTAYTRSLANFIATYKTVVDPASPWANPDVPFSTRLVTYGSKVVDMLYDEGLGFTTPGRYGNQPYVLPSPINKQGSALLVDLVLDRINRAGGCEIITSAPVTELLTEDGRVVGAVAQGADGVTYRVSSKAVILASGGFAQNKEMMQQYNPDYINFYIQAPVSATGDGLILAQKAGADYVCMDTGMTSFFTAYNSKRPIPFLHLSVPLVLVNAQGERFTNERGSYKKYLHEFEKPEHGGRFYFVFDAEGAAITMASLSYPNFLFDTGDLLEFDGIDEMARKLNLPNLAATVNTTMSNALTETADPLGNPRLPVFELNNKMYALRVENGPYITHGGVKTDVDTRVLTPADAPIPGLYAAGDVTGSAECRDGVAYGNGATQALAFGVVVGETVVKDIR
ncbi:flavocytochrome c [Spirochaetia bacterium]|nr:flavocytochrome c [Spirochaetia bacterium]